MVASEIGLCINVILGLRSTSQYTISRQAQATANPKLRKHKIATAEQAATLRVQEVENRADNYEEQVALTDALTTLRILGEYGGAE